MNPVVIACTGGIGSGKTSISRAFSTLGYPVYNCDIRAKELYDEDSRLLEDIVQLAGEDIITNGRLNKPIFAQKIFNNPDLLQQIENLVHPAVIRDFERWKALQHSNIVIFETALYFEKQSLQGLANYVILVVADEETRIERVIYRDGLSEEQVRERMANQLPDEDKIGRADFVFYTNDKSPILPQILKILDNINDNGKDRS